MFAQQGEDDETRSVSNADATHEDLDALLWLQTSAEYEAITRQSFRLAELNLGQALVDPAWTASLEQQKMFSTNPNGLAKLPPAVILDVDETVLDNSKYQSRLIENNEEFSPDSWNSFCREESSPAIPGAVEFIQACRDARITVLYVTNRSVEIEYATRRNLISAGLLDIDDPDLLFTKYERKEWSSNKASRREYLALRYRILMSLGDDLNDFIDLGRRPSSKKRKEEAAKYSDWWGHRWVTLPNPNYGGWERSLYDWNDRSPRSEKLQ
ncbi:MAG: HAD family acid phosphatase, partial [Planctomycetota bacterium]